MKVYKKLAIALVFVVSMLFATTAVTAFPILEKLEVNDVNVKDPQDLGAPVVYIERGETAEIKVIFWDNENDWEDARIKAWIGGYEYDDIRDSTSIFDVENCVKYKKILTLEIPEDMDASDDYTLHIELYNDDDEFEFDVLPLRVEESRHKLSIMDVILRPSSVVEAGSSIWASVRVENLGDRKEEDIKVTVRIPELGVSQRTYLDELESEEEDDDDGEPETSESTNELYLKIPEDARSGVYDVIIEVEYSRSHEVVRKTETITVKGVEEPLDVGQLIISIDSASKEVAQGDEVAYKVMLANLGGKDQILSLEVAGEKLWASSRVDPGFVSLRKDTTGEMYIYLKANDNAAVGKHAFTVKFKAGDAIVTEKSLSADVKAGEEVEPTTIGTKKALMIGAGVLIVLLIILGLIIAFNRMGGEDSGEVPTNEEGQAYY